MQLRAENKPKLDWQKIVEDHEKSGLSQSAYCKQHGLNAVKLSYYRSRFKAKEQLININQAEFKTVKIAQPTQNDSIKISLPNGFQCEFSDCIDVMKIKKLIETLLLC